MSSSHGPGANPARRFAAWMLARHTTLARREIGERLSMQPRQVEALMYRLRKRGPDDTLAAWREAWRGA